MNKYQKLAIILFVIAILAASINAYITFTKVDYDPCETCRSLGYNCNPPFNFEWRDIDSGDIVLLESEVEGINRSTS